MAERCRRPESHFAIPLCCCIVSHCVGSPGGNGIIMYLPKVAECFCFWQNPQPLCFSVQCTNFPPTTPLQVVSQLARRFSLPGDPKGNFLCRRQRVAPQLGTCQRSILLPNLCPAGRQLGSQGALAAPAAIVLNYSNKVSSWGWEPGGSPGDCFPHIPVQSMWAISEKCALLAGILLICCRLCFFLLFFVDGFPCAVEQSYRHTLGAGKISASALGLSISLPKL